MNYDNYILLDHCGDSDSIKVKIVNGFTRDGIKKSLNVKTGWQEQTNEVMYFFPGCSVPRFKVREKYTCTIKPSNATVAFISDELTGSDSTFDFYPNCRWVKEYHIKNWLSGLNDPGVFKRFKAFYDNNNVKKVYITKTLWWEHFSAALHASNTSIDGYLQSVGEESRWSFKYQMQNPENQLIGFKHSSDLSNMKCDIYNESEILNVLNAEQFIIDADKYNELRTIGQSDDDENKIMMMELMSNCNFKESLVHLLFLLKEFGSSIQNLKEAHHVNFKGLLKFIDVDRKELDNMDINKLTRILRKHNKFTRENVTIITSLCSDDYIDFKSSQNLCWAQGAVLKKECLDLIQNDTNN
tara:strand:- start:8954 stop:10018 length:1065 start_codon:yes stop_codon:yes gene_type:complete